MIQSTAAHRAQSQKGQAKVIDPEHLMAAGLVHSQREQKQISNMAGHRFFPNDLQ